MHTRKDMDFAFEKGIHEGRLREYYKHDTQGNFQKSDLDYYLSMRDAGENKNCDELKTAIDTMLEQQSKILLNKIGKQIDEPFSGNATTPNQHVRDLLGRIDSTETFVLTEGIANTFRPNLLLLSRKDYFELRSYLRDVFGTPISNHDDLRNMKYKDFLILEMEEISRSIMVELIVPENIKEMGKVQFLSYLKNCLTTNPRHWIHLL